MLTATPDFFFTWMLEIQTQILILEWRELYQTSHVSLYSESSAFHHQVLRLQRHPTKPKLEQSHLNLVDDTLDFGFDFSFGVVSLFFSAILRYLWLSRHSVS